MKKRTAKIVAPREFFLELNDLFRALEKQASAGELTRETKDALARVLSWLPEMQQTAPRRPKIGAR